MFSQAFVVLFTGRGGGIPAFTWAGGVDGRGCGQGCGWTGAWGLSLRDDHYRNAFLVTIMSTKYAKILENMKYRLNPMLFILGRFSVVLTSEIINSTHVT